MKPVFELTLLHAGMSRSFNAEEGALIVGSDPSCEVVIDSVEVAAHHTSLWLEGTMIQVEDLTGTHGTLVNGYDISGRVEIECPASVQVGPAVLTIRRAATDELPVSGDAASAFQAARSLSGSAQGIEPTAKYAGALGPRSATVQVQYALGPEIARGGMGRIYTGQDPHLKREVAIKVSSTGGGRDPRFIREAEVLGNLPHPNIVPIHAMGEDDDGFPFYSMKLVKGQTLQAVIKSLRTGDPEAKRHFTRERLLNTFRKVCDAIAFAHSKGILHRDLKPENVMVGEFGEVLVMDWGLAKNLGEKETLQDGSLGYRQAPSPPDEDDYGATLDGEVLGTPQYMSPEQAQGRQTELDERSDIYSLGAILYSILTLRPPVEGATLDELLTKVRSGQITSMATKRSWAAQGNATQEKPAEMGSGVPEALRAVTRKAMSLEREKRYQSVEEFATDIEAYMHGYATRAEDAGVLRQLLLMMRRHKAVTALLFFILAGAAGFTVKLIASERLAHHNALTAERNAQTAALNEKKAIQEKEHARRTAAQAHIALSEAAERELDGEEIQRTLAEVPKDLRDQKWNYLNGKLESADITATAKNDSPWTTLVPHPQKPGVLVTLQADGWVRTLDLKKQGGAIEDLFKCDPKNLVGDLLALSSDASKVAMLRHEKAASIITASHIEILQVPSGKKLTDIKVAPSGQFQLSFSPDGLHLLCLYRHSEGSLQRFQMRNVLTGELEWERDDETTAVTAEFTSDSKKLRIFSNKNGLLDLDAKTGDTLNSKSKIPWPAVWGTNSLGALIPLYTATQDWGGLITYTSSPSKFLRKFDAATGKILFENRTLDLRAMGLLPDAALLATLSQRSDRCVVLQYWHSATGLLVKSIPILGNLKGGWKLAVQPKSGDVAVINGTKLWAWNFRASKPEKSIAAGARSFEFAGEPWRVVRTSGGAKLEILDTRLPEFEKKPLATLPHTTKGEKLISTKTGTVLAVNGGGGSTFFRLDGTNYKEVFTGALPTVGPHWALSADGKKLWTGAGVYDTSTGKEICKVDRAGMDVPPNISGISDWVSANTIVEIALVKADWPGAPIDAVERAMILWDAQTGKQIARVDAPDANGLCISPDGKQIAEAGNDMRLRLRNGQTLQIDREFRAHDEAISDVEWHPKLPLLVSSSEDLTVRIWNLKDAHLIEELHGIASQPDQRPERVVISPDGSLLAVKAGGGSFGIFKPASFNPAPAPAKPTPPPKPTPVK